jgi:hypothetical protein
VADLHLIRDVLDNQLVDVRKRKMGRVDGILIELREDAPPRVVALEVGPVTLLRRLSGRLARVAERLLERWGFEGSHRLSPSLVRHVGLDIDIEVDADESPVEEIQRRLRDRVLSHIPGSGA